MLVKLAAILIMAGLLGDSRAAALEAQNQISNLRVKSGWYRLGTPVSDDSNMIPDFSFSKVIALLKTFLMNASEGSLNNTQLSNFKNTTLMTVTKQSVTQLAGWYFKIIIVKAYRQLIFFIFFNLFFWSR